MPTVSPLYTVKILSEEEFDRLPYKHAKTSLGAADPKTGIAYVRDTGHNDITKDTIAHELDELMAKVSPHEEDGIRYKNLAQTFSGFGNAAKQAGGAVAKGVGAVAKAPFQLGAKAFQGIKGLSEPGGVFGKFGGRTSDQVGAPTPPGAQTATFPGVGQGPVPSSGTGAFTNFATGGAGNIFKALGSPTPSGSGGGGILNKLSGSLMDAFTQGGGGEGGGEGGALNSFGKAAVGAGVGALGNIFAPKVPTPDFSAITSRLTDAASGGDTASAIRQLGEQRLTENLNADVTAPPLELFTQGDRISEERLADDLKNLEQAFKAANPNVNIENNSAFLDARNEIVERERLTRGQQRDQVSAEFVQQQKQNRLAEIQTALNLDQAQVAQLVQIAQLEIAQIMAETGVTFGEAQQVKQLFGDLGTAAVQGL